ncbi:MgtC/SapB family protein [Alteribacter populi]|uniref:MgtC/SapB family protein n=1 Tax=Alteribacter populi TaxID=2011011 RepID=UPI000BBB6437|nr:MgtC/SapB family protein [Alteribacter populi]
METLWIEHEGVVMTLRLLLAAVLGGLIGIEREYHHHPAGFRTHLLVSVGSCLIMLLAFFGFDAYIATKDPEIITFDPSRLAAYVVSGIGFLGAGTILVQGYTVRGLTTAASIWVVAGIGLSVGAGMYFSASIATIIVILSLFLLGKVDLFVLNRSEKKIVYVMVEEKHSELSTLIQKLESLRIIVKEVRGEKKERINESPKIEYRFRVEYEKREQLLNFMDAATVLPFVDETYIETKSNEQKK